MKRPTPSIHPIVSASQDAMSTANLARRPETINENLLEDQEQDPRSPAELHTLDLRIATEQLMIRAAGSRAGKLEVSATAAAMAAVL